MFRHDSSFSFSPYGEEYTDLKFALQSKDYTRIYAALKQTPAWWEPSTAFHLANMALECTPSVLKAVLEHCPELKERSWRTQSGGPYAFALGFTYSLMAAAAYLGRQDQMRLLYDQDFPLNEENSLFTSPLEAALEGIWDRVDPETNHLVGAVKTGALDFLLKSPDLTCDAPYKLAPLWAHMGIAPIFDRCLIRVARRLFPQLKAKGSQPPLLPELTISVAYAQENPDLIRRIFRERPPSLSELRGFFRNRTIDISIPDEVLICMLEESLTLYPQLLRGSRMRCLLSVMYLGGSSAVQALEPWIKALEGKRVPLMFCGLPYLGPDGILRRWKAQLGSRITPVLNRNWGLPGPSGSYGSDSYWELPFEEMSAADDVSSLELFLRDCQIIGKPPRGRVSRLGELAVTELPISQLVEALRPDGFLACEEPSAMLLLARELQPDQERVAALLANVRHGEERDPYEL